MSSGAELDVESWLERRPPEPRPKGVLRKGDVVGEWRVMALLGRGRSSEVYRVLNTMSGHEGALKLLTDARCGLDGRFRAERAAVRFLALPSLPRYFDGGIHEGRPYYVMEHLQPLVLPLRREELVRFVAALARAVGELHRAGYIHRDLKPTNVMLRPDGSPVIIDLGLIKRVSDLDPASPRRAVEGLSLVEGRPVGVGTVDFAAPEQLIKGECSVSSDVFALGKVLRSAVDGRPDRRLMSVIAKATSDYPSDRYPDAAAFAAAVAKAVRARRGLRLLVPFGLVAALAVAVWVAPRVRPPRREPPPAEPSVVAPPAVGAVPARPEAGGARKDGASGTPASIDRWPDEDDAAYLRRLLPIAADGDAVAQDRVAEAYFFGRGTATNRTEAVRWYRLSAAAGNPDAQASLGRCLLWGSGCERRVDEAVTWYLKAAHAGNVYAFDGLAFCFMNGIGVDRDETEGFAWARKAAEKGYAPSECMVGECFLTGRGVAKDDTKALFWLQSAARHGNVRARRLQAEFFTSDRPASVP